MKGNEIEGEKEGYRPMRATVTGVTRENGTIRTFGLSLKDAGGRAFSSQSGQFIMISVPGIGEAPFSMCSPPGKSDEIEVSIRNVGNVTGKLFGLSKGDTVWIRGPYGHGYPVERLKGKDIVLVAGGIGFPPLASVVEHVIANRDDYGRVWVLYGTQSVDDMIYGKRMKRWKKDRDLDVLVAIEEPCREWKGCVGVVTKLFDRLEIDKGNCAGLSCGPPIMLKFVTKGFLDMGIPEKDIYLSLERRMQCGIGKCGHCNIGDRYVCTDGPVFSYADIKHLKESIW